MKTNIGIDLTDDQRNSLACLLAGKSTKALVTRAQVTDLVRGFIEGCLEAPESPQEARNADPVPEAQSRPKAPAAPQAARRGLRFGPGYPNITPDLADALEARGYGPYHPAREGYIRGWYLQPSTRNS